MTYVLKKWRLLRSAWGHREDEICLNFISQSFLHFFYILIYQGAKLIKQIESVLIGGNLCKDVKDAK
jgi:hypothetical protein